MHETSPDTRHAITNPFRVHHASTLPDRSQNTPKGTVASRSRFEIEYTVTPVSRLRRATKCDPSNPYGPFPTTFRAHHDTRRRPTTLRQGGPLPPQSPTSSALNAAYLQLQPPPTTHASSYDPRNDVQSACEQIGLPRAPLHPSPLCKHATPRHREATALLPQTESPAK